jgi:hypothetical protein
MIETNDTTNAVSVHAQVFDVFTAGVGVQHPHDVSIVKVGSPGQVQGGGAVTHKKFKLVPKATWVRVQALIDENGGQLQGKLNLPLPEEVKVAFHAERFRVVFITGQVHAYQLDRSIDEHLAKPAGHPDFSVLIGVWNFNINGPEATVTPGEEKLTYCTGAQLFHLFVRKATEGNRPTHFHQGVFLQINFQATSVLKQYQVISYAVPLSG